MAQEFTIEEIANLFHITDEDKNGKLTRNEIINIMIQIKGGIKPTEEEINNCFLTMDINKDGEISEEEFLFTMIKWLNIISNNDKNYLISSNSLSNNKKRTLDETDLLNDDHNDNNNNNNHSNSNNIFNKKKTITNMANFFLQFAPVNDFYEEQKKILLKKRRNIDMTSVHREYPQYTSEQKAQLYQNIQEILLQGRDVILHEIYSLDWNIVLNGVMRVKTLLSIVEIFPTSNEK